MDLCSEETMFEVKPHLGYLNPLPSFEVQAGVSGLYFECLTDGWTV